MPISYHFHGSTALLVALVVVSGAILNTHLYFYLFYRKLSVIGQCDHISPILRELQWLALYQHIQFIIVGFVYQKVKHLLTLLTLQCTVVNSVEIND